MPIDNLDIITPDEEALSNEDVVSFYNAYYKALEQVKSDSFDTRIDHLTQGDKTVYNKTIIERKDFDDGFIELLQSAFPHFLKISRDPKRGLKYEDDVVGVEKAHKITSKSVKHLASHTQNISKVEDDDVIPSKLLVTFAEEDLAMYENRAYKTLVNTIITFLKRRQKTVGDNVESHRYDVIKFNHKTQGKNTKFDIDLNIKMTRPIEEDTTKAQELLDKINNLLDKYQGISATPFMRELVNAKDVRSPLLKTNIFLHNPDFQILYNTWIFMERYQTEPYNVNVTEYDHENDLIVDKDLSRQSLALINELAYLRQVNSDEVSVKEHYFENNIKHELKLRQDIDFLPGEFELENYLPSEVLLQKTCELYKRELEDKFNRLDSKEVSARQTISDMLKAVNSINNNLFDYKDTDLDNLSDGNEEKYQAQKKRYELLRILREEKEIDLETTRLEEQLALEHLNSIERKLNKELTEIEVLAREGLSNRYKARREAMIKEREELFAHQQAVADAHKEELMDRARERAIKIGKRGYHSKVHDKQIPRHKVPVYIYDSYPDDTLEIDLMKNEVVEDFKMESKRDYSNSSRKTESEINAKVLAERLAREEKLRLEKAILSHAFAPKTKARKATRERVQLAITSSEDTLDLSGKPDSCDFLHQKPKGDEAKKHKIKKDKKRKLVGHTRTLVKKKKLEAQLRKTSSKKVDKPNNNRKLVSKKRIK